MGQLRHVLKHVARRLRVVDDVSVDWIEGEPGDGPEPVKGPGFPAVLFLPLGTEDTARPRSKQVSRPTLMWEPVNADTGAAVEVVSPDDELLIFAPELAGSFAQEPDEPAGTGRWMVDGAPQPFGPPGRVIGLQAIVKQVRS